MRSPALLLRVTRRSLPQVLAVVPLLVGSHAVGAANATVIRVPSVWGPGIVRPRGDVRVAAGASLTIAAGTRVEMPNGSRIAVDRSARLHVEGTALQPVVLTCMGVPTVGCWEGVVVAGHAPVNEGALASPPARGVGAGGCREITGDGRVGSWGGCDAADSSGVLRFVRITHAVTGLELLGIGARTVIDNVAVSDAMQGGVRIAGGTVDVRHLVVTGSGGSALTYEQGWRGRGQFLHLDVALANTDASGIRGRNAALPDAVPRSQPTLANVTITGRGTLRGAPVGIRLLDGAGLALRNALVLGHLTMLDVDGAATCAQVGTTIDMTRSLVAGDLGDADADPECGAVGGADAERSYLAQPSRFVMGVSAETAAVMLVAPFNASLPDFRPTRGQPAATATAITPDDFFREALWYGASEPAGTGNVIPWHSGWTSPLRAAARVTLAAVTTTSQVTLAGAPTNTRPAVRVTDASGAPVAGAEVRFASSSGTVAGPVRITSADGIAQVDQWTIATAPGTTTMSASLSGASPVLFTALGQPAAFSIALQNVGPPIAPEFEATLVAARDRWQQIVFRDVPDANGITVSGGTCGTTSTVGPLTIDDVLILVTFTAIDGPGKVLGQAGPCAIRSTERQTIYGVMMLDSADARTLYNQGRLDHVVRHEMGHILGIGTLWTEPTFDCLRNPSAVGAPLDTYYRCPEGRLAFDSLGGAQYSGGNAVPVENCATCALGNINAHWREDVLQDELMTGFLDVGSNPLSRLTAASLIDLGYGVNLAAADPFAYVPVPLADPRAPRTPLGPHVRRGPITVIRTP
jgi:hypothetical protein